MNKNKYIFFVLLFMFCFRINALTYGGCEYSNVSRLKSFVSNINITYDYRIESNHAYFDVTISNLISGVYFIDSQTGLKYGYENATNGEIIIKNYTKNSGTYMFYSALNECYGVKLGNRYYSFPDYNIFYDDPLCQKNRDYPLCQKWMKITFSRNEFEKKIEEYNQKSEQTEETEEIEVSYESSFFDVLVKFYIEYYYFILLGIIVVCILVMIATRKKNSFKL